MALTIDIADAVVAELAGGAFSEPITPVRRVLPEYELADLKDLRVTVVPASVEIEGASRAVCQHDVRIDIGIPKLFWRCEMAANHACFRGIGVGVARLVRGWLRSRGDVGKFSSWPGRPACRSLRAPCGSAHNGLRLATGSLSGGVTMLVY